MKNFLRVFFKSILLVTILMSFSGIDTSVKSINSNTNSCFKSESPDVLTAFGKVTGVVYDGGSPIAGAYVAEAGTFNGVITDIDGRYSINVNTPNTCLRYSKEGYITVAISIDSAPCVKNVWLLPDE
jgi:hypothetical protein